MTARSEVADKIQAFFSRFPERKYQKGQILLYADEKPEHVFFLVEGRVREYDISQRGDEVVVNVFRPGAFFPMSKVMNDLPSVYFFRTEDNVRLHVVPAREALTFLQGNPDVLYDLLSRVYRGADVLMGRLVQLMSGSALTRLLFELANEARKVASEEPAVRLQVTEGDLAARTGLSRETVSREMHVLKDKGLVEVSSEGILIKNKEALYRKLD